MTRLAEGPRPGRRPSTSRAAIERTALRLFDERGFDAVSIDDIAAQVGIGRRTFFRYFPSKNDVVWGHFDELVDQWDRWLQAQPEDIPALQAIRRAVLHFNDFDDLDGSHRVRMALILRNPVLVAHSTLRYQRWQDVLQRYVAGRLGGEGDQFLPRLVAQLALGAAIASYDQWLRDEQAELSELLDTSLTFLSAAGPLLGHPQALCS